MKAQTSSDKAQRAPRKASGNENIQHNCSKPTGRSTGLRAKHAASNGEALGQPMQASAGGLSIHMPATLVPRLPQWSPLAVSTSSPDRISTACTAGSGGWASGMYRNAGVQTEPVHIVESFEQVQPLNAVRAVHRSLPVIRTGHTAKGAPATEPVVSPVQDVERQAAHVRSDAEPTTVALDVTIAQLEIQSKEGKDMWTAFAMAQHAEEGGGRVPGEAASMGMGAHLLDESRDPLLGKDPEMHTSSTSSVVGSDQWVREGESCGSEGVAGPDPSFMLAHDLNRTRRMGGMGMGIDMPSALGMAPSGTVRLGFDAEGTGMDIDVPVRPSSTVGSPGHGMSLRLQRRSIPPITTPAHGHVLPESEAGIWDTAAPPQREGHIPTGQSTSEAIGSGLEVSAAFPIAAQVSACTVPAADVDAAYLVAAAADGAPSESDVSRPDLDTPVETRMRQLSQSPA